jgi:hypothetical protein
MEVLRKAQSPAGSLEPDVSTDDYIIILLRTLGIDDEQLIRNGEWQAFSMMMVREIQQRESQNPCKSGV